MQICEGEYEGKYGFVKWPAKDLVFFRDFCPKFHYFLSCCISGKI